jgi:hypothetical protein
MARECEYPYCKTIPEWSYMHYGKGVRFLCQKHKEEIIDTLIDKGTTIPHSRIVTQHTLDLNK